LSRSRGSAPVDFLLGSIPLIFISISTFALLFNGFAKNVAQAEAVDAARYAALADQTSDDATARAQEILATQLGPLFQPNVLVEKQVLDGNCEFRSTVTVTPVALGFLGSAAQIREEAFAVCELQG